jgi:hypothetical protein
MTNLYLLVPTLLTIAFSLMIVRAGAIALMMTGMSYEKAKFQALSAFSGTGFTTREAERVVNNPQRRKIVSWLMVLGNAGIVTVIVATTSSFSGTRGLETGINALVLISGLMLILLVAKHTSLVTHWEKFTQKQFKRLKIFDDDSPVDELLHITEGYGVLRIMLMTNSPFIGHTLSEVNAGLENSLVLGIERDKVWLPTPRLTRKLAEEDTLIIYGLTDELSKHFNSNFQTPK